MSGVWDNEERKYDQLATIDKLSATTDEEPKKLKWQNGALEQEALEQKTVSPDKPVPTKQEGAGSYEKACEEAVRREEAGEDWEPILIGTLDADECEALYGKQRDVQVENVGGGRLRAWLFKMESIVHSESVASVQENTSDDYKAKNKGTLFSRLPNGSEYEIRMAPAPRFIGDYYELYSNQSTRGQGNVERQFDNWARSLELHAVKLENHFIKPDGMVCIVRGTSERSHQPFDTEFEHNLRIVATPFIYEEETSHRNLYQSTAHAGQMLQAWPDVTSVSTVLLEKDMAYNDKDFYAVYLRWDRIFDANGQPTRESRLAIALNFGTRPFPAIEATNTTCLRVGQKFGIVDFLGVTGRALQTATNFRIVSVLTTEDKNTLRRLLHSYPPANSAPDDLERKLTIVIPPETLYAESEFRAASTPLRIYLFDLLRDARIFGASNKRPREKHRDTEPPPARVPRVTAAEADRLSSLLESCVIL